jgi:CBS domain-containing protein
MLCPVCRHDNFEGDDYCENCGADLAAGDAPATAMEFEGLLLGQHLEALVGAATIVDPGTSVHAALERMHREGLDCLLVVSEGRLVGIFTERDGVLKVAGRRAEAFDIRDVMTADPVVLRKDDTLAVAINKMAVGGFRHIPVMDGDVPVGVVAARDVFRHFLEVLG